MFVPGGRVSYCAGSKAAIVARAGALRSGRRLTAEIAIVMQRNRKSHPRIVVVPYDSSWPLKFERASQDVATALGSNLLAIHHIGSTSIPGLCAKPVIDMLVVVAELSRVDQRSNDMQALGYQAIGDFGIEGRRYFRRDDSSGRRTDQVHAFAEASPQIHRHLAFRDFLRSHPSIADQYGELKQRLAAAHPHDMEAYMDGKDDFIRQMQSRALDWLNRTQSDVVQ
jgi:GrpB-like predicted nucleotidyltransferase (UPF0157 family)